MTTTAAQRKAKERGRKRALGLVAVTVWVRPEDREAVRQLEAQLTAKTQNPPRGASLRGGAGVVKF